MRHDASDLSPFLYWDVLALLLGLFLAIALGHGAWLFLATLAVVIAMGAWAGWAGYRALISLASDSAADGPDLANPPASALGGVDPAASHEAALAAGHLRQAKDGRRSRPTVRGWLRYTSLAFPPARWITAAVRRREAHALRREPGSPRRASHAREWLALAGGAALFAYGGTASPGALLLGVAAHLGMRVTRVTRTRKGMHFGVSQVIRGGVAGFAAATAAILLAVSLLSLLTLSVGPLLKLFAAAASWPAIIGGVVLFAAYVLGPAALLWGWSRIACLRPLPRQVS